MTGDLPDYEKKIIIVTPTGEYPAIVQVDLRKILGEDFITPTIAGCVPTSIENEAIAYDVGNDWFKTYIENDAIAYDSENDRFKVDIEAMSVGAIETTADLAKVLGAALAHNNPVISRLTDGTAFIDPRDVSDRAARLLGKVYGDQGVLTQRGASLDLYVQLRNAGSEIDPRDIRTLVSSDKVTVQQGTPAQLSGYAYQGGNWTVTAIQTTADNLKATVTQAEKDRTISSVDATATAVQISIAGLNGNSSALHTPAAGKAIRLKLISIEHTADVDIGYRFGAAGTVYYLRITKGPYATNLVGCNNQGAADAALYLNSSGATNVKGYVLLTEV